MRKLALIGSCSLAACAGPKVAETHHAESTFACPAGTYDMLDWLTLDSDLRGQGKLVSAANPLYTRVDADRFWWMKTDQGDTWDLDTYDDNYIYFAATENGFHTPWACKPATDATTWKAVRRCVTPGDVTATITNPSSKFEILSSNEVQATSGDQGTTFVVEDGGVMDWGSLGQLPTLILDYNWNCWNGTCHQLEQYYLTQRYGLVRWRYSTDGVQQAETTYTAFQSATVPAPMYGCTTPATYSLASIVPGGAADGASSFPAIDDTGRFVAYASDADNLVAGDTNAASDIFIYDNYWHVVAGRASVASDGTQANGPSRYPVVSRNGQARYIAFESDASNLVPGDTNNATDIFVYDRWNHTIELASVGPDGQGNGPSNAPSISADGCRIAFHSKATNLVANDTNDGPGTFGTDVFIRDRCANTIERVVGSTGNQLSFAWYPSIDDSGRFVAYLTGDPDAMPGGNGQQQVYLYDSYWHVTTALLSSASDGTIGDAASYYATISGNGRYIALVTSSTDLGGAPQGTLNVYEKDRWTGTTTLVSGDTGGGYATPPAVSSDGRFVGYLWNGSGVWRPYLRDVWTGQLVAPTTLGAIASPVASGLAISTHQRTIAGMGIADRISLGYVSGSDVVLRTATVP